MFRDFGGNLIRSRPVLMARPNSSRRPRQDPESIREEAANAPRPNKLAARGVELATSEKVTTEEGGSAEGLARRQRSPQTSFRR